VGEILVEVFSAMKQSDIAEVAHVPKYMPSRLVSDSEVKRQANADVLTWRFVGLMPLNARRKNPQGRAI
jgi:hypothetical protein